MRRSIPIKIVGKLPGSKPQIRLYVMSDYEARVFDDAIDAMSRTTTLQTAQFIAEKAVMKILMGEHPPSEAPPALHDLRRVFPTLDQEGMEALPRLGCPRGRVSSLIFGIKISEGDSDSRRVVRYDMSSGQTEVFNQAMGRLMKEDSMSRDDAWVFMCSLVSMLIAGGELQENPNQLAVIMHEHFGALSKEEVLALPVATEDDVRLWQFTEEPE